MQYYFRDQYECEACDHFDAVTQDYPNIRFFQPSPHKAPWHVQAILDAADGVPIVLNFWPHKEKAQRQGCMSFEGRAAAKTVIEEALSDQAALRADSLAFSVIDEG